MEPISSQNLKIFIVIILSFVKNFSQAQQSAGSTLQANLDNLDTRIRNIERVQSLSNQRFSFLEQLSANNSQLLNALIQSFNAQESAISTLSRSISSLNSNLNSLGGKIGGVEAEISSVIVPAMTSLKTSTAQLEKNNQIWKNNFKIINSTFTALKQKISFRLPVIV